MDPIRNKQILFIFYFIALCIWQMTVSIPYKDHITSYGYNECSAVQAAGGTPPSNLFGYRPCVCNSILSKGEPVVLQQFASSIRWNKNRCKKKDIISSFLLLISSNVIVRELPEI